MPIMRNPFRKQDENARPATSGVDKPANGSPTAPIDIQEKEPAEYKLSGKSTHILPAHNEINDSGVFIPPSPPPERKSFWTTSSSRSTTSSRSVFNENEPFNISRESFDSYRRSFDISARSPVIFPETKPRSSLDSRTFLPPQPRSSNSFHRPLQVPGTQKEEEVEALEEVALDDPKPQPKKRGMFSRIMDSDSHSERPGSHQNQDGVKSSWHHFGGRKRGQSGQGAELGSIPKREETPKPEAQSQVRREERERTVQTTQVSQAPQVQTQTQAQPQAQAQATAGAERERGPQAPQAQAQAQTTTGAEKENAQAPVVKVNGVS